MSLNKVLIIGHCCADPETKFLPSGGAVTNLSIATNKKWKDKNGQKQETTEFHRVVFFNRLAEIAGEYLKKGSKVYVEGSLRTNKWQDKDGNDRYTTEIIASEMQMLDSRNGGASTDNSNYHDESLRPGATTDFVGGQQNNEFDMDIPF